MKSLIVAVLMIFSLQVQAGCESTIVEGGHTALNIKNAKAGAFEEAKDACPTGDISPASLDCTKVDGDIGVAGKPATRCIHQVYCNICGDDLARKYEALE